MSSFRITTISPIRLVRIQILFVILLIRLSEAAQMDFNEGDFMQTGDGSGLSQITDHLLLTLCESQ